MSSVYEIVTGKIIHEMESGSIPWMRPWTSEGPAINYITRKEYRGINRVLLVGGEYLTFKQINELGGTVKKGEHASLVVFWKSAYTTKTTDPDGNETELFHDVPVLRYYNVFSVHQCEGIPSKLPPVEKRENNPIESAQKIMDEYIVRSGVFLHFLDPNRAFYNPASDSINLPPMENFSGSAEYYSTAFHESAHSTGHKSRLGRLSKTAHFGSESYSKEELIAEMSAAFLCNRAGIENTLRNSAAYIQNWMKALHDDAKLIVFAAAGAERATRYILNETN